MESLVGGESPEPFRVLFRECEVACWSNGSSRAKGPYDSLRRGDWSDVNGSGVTGIDDGGLVRSPLALTALRPDSCAAAGADGAAYMMLLCVVGGG